MCVPNNGKQRASEKAFHFSNIVALQAVKSKLEIIKYAICVLNTSHLVAMLSRFSKPCVRKTLFVFPNMFLGGHCFHMFGARPLLNTVNSDIDDPNNTWLINSEYKIH